MTSRDKSRLQVAELQFLKSVSGKQDDIKFKMMILGINNYRWIVLMILLTNAERMEKPCIVHN
jgi:hypothetical protein